MNGSGFKRLRLVTAATTAGVGLVPMVAGPAMAAGTAPLSTFKKTTTAAQFSGPFIEVWKGIWALRNTAPAPSGGSGFGVLSETGGFTGACAPTGCIGGSGPYTPYVGFGVTKVGTASYTAPDGKVSVEGPTVLANRKVVGGLAVSMRYDFMNKHLLRVLVTLTNPKPNKVKKTVAFTGGLASAASTTIAHSPGVDGTFEPTDSWIETTDGSPPPTVMIARGDRNTSARSDPTVAGKYIDTYTLHIGARKTVRLLYYTRFYATFPHEPSTDFNTGATLFAADLLAGLSASERKGVVNWTTLPPPPKP